MNHIVFLYQDRLYTTQMETPGSLTIGSGKKDDFKIENMEGQITIRQNRKGQLTVESTKPYPFYENDVQKNSMVVLDVQDHVALYIHDHQETASESLKIPYNCIVRVGRSDKCHVTIKNPFVSGRHFTIRSESGVIRVEDNNSTNGLYLNGKRISKAKIHSGDVLSILHIHIRLVGNELFFDNVGQDLIIHGLDVETAIGGQAAVEDTGAGMLKYRRSPRTQEQLPTEDILLASAPNAQGKYEKRRGMFASFLGTGAMFAANMATMTMSPALMAARAASLVSPVTSMVTQSGSEKQRKGKMAEYEQMRMEKYGQYIAEQKAKIEEVARIQREILTRENPAATECLESLRQLNRSLWERDPADRDFLDVRLGMGYENLCVNVKARDEGGFRMDTDEVKALAEQIVEETRIVDNVPARLSMRKYHTIGIIGDRSRMTNLVRNMLVSLTTAHCFEEVRIVGIFDKKEQKQWESLRWLPHIWDEGRQMRYLTFDPEDAHGVCELLADVLGGRVKSTEGSYQRDVAPIPHYVFLLGARTHVEKEGLMQLLTSNHPDLGATALFLFDEMAYLPPSCQFIVDVDNGPCGFVRNEVNNKFFFTEDIPVSDTQLDAYARMMSAIELEGFAVESEIPQGITFLKGFGVSRVEQLDVLNRWKNSQPYKTLAAPIGAMAGGKVFALDIHQNAHGPHGLVGGGTGSGKSETLLSYVLSMCVNYHPYDVAFLVIDWKGGGTADVLMDLPHVVGKITNIDTNIRRTLISLKSEMDRRQKLFAKYTQMQYECKDIYEYHKLYHAGKAKEPLPHLIIISDEFAELKKNEPEFMAEVKTASRIGRSLGVHLVLATQSPNEAVDKDIQDNSDFRLCLRVNGPADSRAMIARPDAAFITQKGRAYVRVGQDEVFAMFQSYWSGADYDPNRSVEDSAANPVRIVAMNGARSKQLKKEKRSSGGMSGQTMTELKAVRQYLCRVTAENGIPKLPGPWLPELPRMLTLPELQVPGGFDGHGWQGELPWLRIPIGMYDAPVLQEQGVQYIDLATEGHYGIYGAPGTGKTTLLKSMIMALGYYYRPEDVNIYILDCGGWSMNVFAGMPHVGGIALDCEEEKFQKLQQMLLDEINRRKRQFMRSGVSSLTAYRELHGGGMPAIVLAIDNLVPVFDQFPDMENLLVTIAREGATYGIYMIYTSNNTTGVRYKVLQNIRGAVAFELTDKGDYPAIVGRLDGMTLPKVSGRAFIKSTSPMEFQAAMYIKGETDRERTDNLKAVCAAMDAAWDGPRPEPIPVMPEELSFADLYKNYQNRMEIPMGIAYDTIRPVTVDLTNHYNFLVSGTMNSGKSKFLAGMAAQIKEKHPTSKFYVFDSTKGSLRSLASMPGTRYISMPAEGINEGENEDVLAMVQEIGKALSERQYAQIEARAKQGDSFSSAQFAEELDLLCIVIDDVKDFVNKISNRCLEGMKKFCRAAQGLGLLVLAAGRVADLGSLNSIEAMTNTIVSNQKAIGLGGSASIHSYLNNDLSYKEKELDAGEGNGYLFDGGHCRKIKLPQ